MATIGAGAFSSDEALAYLKELAEGLLSGEPQRWNVCSSL